MALENIFNTLSADKATEVSKLLYQFLAITGGNRDDSYINFRKDESLEYIFCVRKNTLSVLYMPFSIRTRSLDWITDLGFALGEEEYSGTLSIAFEKYSYSLIAKNREQYKQLVHLYQLLGREKCS